MKRSPIPLSTLVQQQTLVCSSTSSSSSSSTVVSTATTSKKDIAAVEDKIELMDLFTPNAAELEECQIEVPVMKDITIYDTLWDVLEEQMPSLSSFLSKANVILLFQLCNRYIPRLSYPLLQTHLVPFILLWIDRYMNSTARQARLSDTYPTNIETLSVLFTRIWIGLVYPSIPQLIQSFCTYHLTMLVRTWLQTKWYQSPQFIPSYLQVIDLDQQCCGSCCW